jgi:hypothetical protein
MRATATGIAFPADIAIDIGTEPSLGPSFGFRRPTVRRPSAGFSLPSFECETPGQRARARDIGG